jgi:hypothetical protein
MPQIVGEAGRRWLVVAAGLLVGTSLTARAQRPDDPMPQMLAKVRSEFADTAHRWLPDVTDLRFARDSASQRLLSRVGVSLPVDEGSPLICPGSTDSTGHRVADSTGYTMAFGLSTPWATDTLRTFGLGWSCIYLAHGHRRGFHQGVGWTIVRRGVHWVILKRVMLNVT